MLTIICNDNFHKEREYIIDVIFGDFWNLDYQIVYEKRHTFMLKQDSVVLEMADVFFSMDKDKYLHSDSLPVQPLLNISVPHNYSGCVTDNNIPLIYSDSMNGELFRENEKYCCLDVLGSAFFMLTRYEEYVNKERDEMDRFLAESSLAYQEGFAERPIINEYLEILFQWLKNHTPDLNRKKRAYSFMPTHDVDYPFWGLAVDNWHKIRMLVGDIVKMRGWNATKDHLIYSYHALRKQYELDPYNTFDMLMKASEENNLTSHFYFMTAQGKSDMDGNYDIFHPQVRKLIHDIIERGHKVGIHLGFNSYNNQSYIKEEIDKLRNLISEDKLPIASFGGRQHWLRWHTPNTWKYEEAAGMEYDTTLGYVECLGFRCGICYDYPVYNIGERKRYKLREYPLIVMDGSGLADYGLGISETAMFEKCSSLKEKVRKYNGTFVLLWHNSFFLDIGYEELYKQILAT